MPFTSIQSKSVWGTVSSGIQPRKVFLPIFGNTDSNDTDVHQDAMPAFFNKSLFIGSDLNEGGDLETESFELFLVTANCWPDSRPQTHGDVTGGRAFPGIWRTPGPAPRPNPMPALLAAGGSGPRLLGRHKVAYLGVFHPGNRPGILKERPPPSACKGLI